jgi:hypothetical protein
LEMIIRFRDAWEWGLEGRGEEFPEGEVECQGSAIFIALWFGAKPTWMHLLVRESLSWWWEVRSHNCIRSNISKFPPFPVRKGGQSIHLRIIKTCSLYGAGTRGELSLREGELFPVYLRIRNRTTDHPISFIFPKWMHRREAILPCRR